MMWRTNSFDVGLLDVMVIILNICTLKCFWQTCFPSMFKSEILRFCFDFVGTVNTVELINLIINISGCSSAFFGEDHLFPVPNWNRNCPFSNL